MTERNDVSQCPRCGGAVFPEQNISHVCDPGEVEIVAHMNSEKAMQETKGSIVIHAHNATNEWGNLKCEHSRMKLPIRFVLAMEELDRDIDRMRDLEREAHKSSEEGKKL